MNDKFTNNTESIETDVNSQKCVQLPYEYPPFANTQGAAAPTLAMLGHPTAFNQILNRGVSLGCDRRFLTGYTGCIPYIPDINIYNLSCIEDLAIDLKFTKKYCMEIIKDMIDCGYYVFFLDIDDYYLPGKSWYGERHFPHDGIICGYDDGDGSLSIAAHTKEWVFDLFRIPQSSFIEGLNSSQEMEKTCKLVGFKVKDDMEVNLDPGQILWRLKCHVNSSLEKYPITGKEDVRGVVTYDYIGMYLKKIADGEIPHEKMDWRTLRPIWEHKKCMLRRIKALEELNSWENDLSERYVSLVDISNQIRMSYAIYHKKPRKALLDSIILRLEAIKEQDIKFSTELIEKMSKKKEEVHKE